MTCSAKFHFSGAQGSAITQDANGEWHLPKIDLFESRRICPWDEATGRYNCIGSTYDNKRGFTDNADWKQLRITPRADIFVGGVRVGQYRPILRVPFHLSLTSPPDDPDWGNPGGSYTDHTEASGWWIKNGTGALNGDGAGGYATIRYTAPLRTAPIKNDAAFSWTLPMELEPDPCGDRDCAVTHMPMRGYDILLDPDLHHGSIGTSLKRVTFPAPGKTNVFTPPSADRTITIPAGLSPGRHKLVLISRQPMVDGQPCSAGHSCTTFDVPIADESTLQGPLLLYFSVID
jgi:hypothetical protein